MSAEFIADTLVSTAALVGVLLLIGLISRHGTADPLNRRFLFGLGLIAALLATRVIYWSTAIAIFNTLTIVSAGLIPLGALLLTEGLLRRHAPRALKMPVAAGSVLFVLFAFLPGWLVEPLLSWSLLCYQFFAFIAIGWLAVMRDRDKLSSAENRMVDRIAMSLLLIVPAMLTDFHIAKTGVPVRLGGIAILYLCWLSVSLGRPQLSHRDTLSAFLVLTASSVLAGLAIALIAGLDNIMTVQAISVILSSVLVAAIYNDSTTSRTEERRESLIRHMAEGPLGDSEAFLRALQSHILVEGALILKPHDLADFDLDVLARLLRLHTVCGKGELHPGGQVSESMTEQLAWLFEKYEATHVLLASDNPLTLLALNMPALAASPGAETELKAMQRMTWLISRQEKIE